MIKKLITYLFIALLGIIYVPVLTVAPLEINAAKVNLSFTASNFAGRNRILSQEVNMAGNSLIEFEIKPSDFMTTNIGSYIEFYDASHNSAGSFSYSALFPYRDLKAGGVYVVNKWDLANMSGYSYAVQSFAYFKISIDIHPNTATAQFMAYMGQSTYDVAPTGYFQLHYKDNVNYDTPQTIHISWFKETYPQDYYGGTDPIDIPETGFLFGWGVYDRNTGYLNKYSFNRPFYDYEFDVAGGSIVSLWPMYYYYSRITYTLVDANDGASYYFNSDVIKLTFGDYIQGTSYDYNYVPNQSDFGDLVDDNGVFVGWYENVTGTQIGSVDTVANVYRYPSTPIDQVAGVVGNGYMDPINDYAFTLELYSRIHYNSKLTLYDGFTQYGSTQSFLYYPANINTLPTKTGYEFAGWYTRNNVKYGNFYNSAKTIWSFPNQPTMEVLNTNDYDGSKNYIYSTPVDLKLYAHFTPSLGTDGFPTTGTPTAPLAIATFLADLGLYNFPGLMFIYVLVSLLVTGLLVALLKLDMLTIIIVNLVLTGIFLFSNLLPLYVAIILSIMYLVIIIMSINGKGGRMLNE